jgi:asparagine synthase (glutamine-hydrolysing)
MHVAALRPARRVTAYSTDLIDDDGVSAVTIVRRLLCDLALDVDVHVVDPASCTAEPAWWPWGPRADALPAVNARVADLAADAGVDVLLSGDGADELLAVPRFAAASLARAVGPRAACRYLADSRRSGPGVPGETLALVSSLMGPRRRARWYWATNWPQLCRPEASEVVCRPLRQEVLEWARLCIDTSVAEHATQRRTWADADRFDSFWPHSYIPPAGDVPEASPFLHEDVVAAALAGPVTARYDAALPTAYQRCKSAVVSLIPEHARTALPGRKQYFSCALAKAFEGPIAVPACAEAGLLDQDRLMVETDTSVRMMAAAVESWLASAVSAGAGVSSRIDLRAGPSAP